MNLSENMRITRSTDGNTDKAKAFSEYVLYSDERWTCMQHDIFKHCSYLLRIGNGTEPSEVRDDDKSYVDIDPAMCVDSIDKLISASFPQLNTKLPSGTFSNRAILCPLNTQVGVFQI
jgi:hypothetical protein